MSKRIYQMQIPVFLAAFIIALILLQNYLAVGNEVWSPVGDELVLWSSALYGWMLFFGYVTLQLGSLRIIQRGMRGTKSPLYYPRIVLVGSFVVFLLLGILLPEGFLGDLYQKLYNYVVQYTAQASSIAWIALAYGAYRLFRPTSIQTVALIVAWFLSFGMRLSLWTAIFPPIIDIGAWVLDVPAIAASRGTLLVGGIGSSILAVRALFGKEQGIIEMETGTR